MFQSYTVVLNYDRFRPTGTAYITFTKPDFTPNALKILHGNTLGGSRIEAKLVRSTEVSSTGSRTRGIKGKAEAAERGLFDGRGPNAGLTRNATNVVISGLPGKSTSDIIKGLVKPYKLAGYEDKGDIIKVDLYVVSLTPPFFGTDLRNTYSPVQKMAVTSSFVIRLATVSEAHRLVRDLHMTLYRPDLFLEKYPVKAHVIY